MEFELRKKALASIESNVTEVQVVIIVLTRELAFKVCEFPVSSLVFFLTSYFPNFSNFRFHF
ncbi:unnamed protein product [Wuchereria bancrofti]|uniref:Uncharacterized protein n=1 Tax=Wuchereria bancrofti TaxID=6293 RepID=A0A3P7DLC2_WUCBA|nr:unnamed protein product [Wuchereria bancrofti]